MEKLTKRDLAYFKKALTISELSNFPKIKIGCIAVYKKQIIGIGYNEPKTSPIQAKYNKLGHRDLFSNNGKPIHEYLHAEIMCINMIRHLNIDFSRVKIYVSRTNYYGDFACCRPCSACEYAIRELGIKYIYYTDNNNLVKEIYGEK